MKYLLPIGLLALAGCGNPEVGRYQTVELGPGEYLQADTVTGQTRICLVNSTTERGWFSICTDWAEPDAFEDK